MAFVQKNRTVSTYSGGKLSYPFGFDSHPSQSLKEEFNTGYTHPGPPYVGQASWDLEVKDLRGFRLSGTLATEQGDYIYDNFRLYNAPKTFVTVAPWGELENRVLAHANPNQPVVDLPLFLWELRELPSLIFLAGMSKLGRKPPGGIASGFGSGYLTWQFGWAPLLSDLRKLYALAQSMDDRISSIEAASEKKQIEGKIWNRTSNRSLGTRTEHGISYKLSGKERTRAWYTGRYNLPELPSKTDSRFDQFKRALGLPINMATLWNMIPWSWLIDYFVSIGSYLEATRGGLDFELSDVCIMMETKLHVTPVLLQTDGGWRGKPNLYGHTMFHDKRRRFVHLPRPQIVRKPFLTNGQLGILAALAASRSRY